MGVGLRRAHMVLLYGLLVILVIVEPIQYPLYSHMGVGSRYSPYGSPTRPMRVFSYSIAHNVPLLHPRGLRNVLAAHKVPTVGPYIENYPIWYPCKYPMGHTCPDAPHKYPMVPIS